MISKTKKGISLIVLVITIIVMIILAGAIIISLANSGIIGKAQEAVDKTNEAQLNQIAQLAWAEAYADGVRTVEDVNGVKGFKSRVEDALRANRVDLSTISLNVTTSGATVTVAQSETISDLAVGDYVNYKPEGASISNATVYASYNASGIYGTTPFKASEKMRFVNGGIEIDGEISGKYTDETNGRGHAMSDWYDTQTVAKQDTKWRVLKNDGKNIYLISEEPLNTVTLGGKEGYTNGQVILNEICNAFYGSSIATVRSINEDDINSVFRPEFDANIETNWTYKDASTGLEVNFASGIRTIKAAETKYGFTFRETATKTANGITYTIYNGPTTEQYSLAPKYYMFDPGNTKGGTSAADVAKYAANPAYDLVFNAFDDASSKYWVATQCIHIADKKDVVNDDATDFCLNYIKNGYMSGEYLHGTVDCENPDVHEYSDVGMVKTLNYRPIVILNAATEFEAATAVNGIDAWDIQD